MSKLGHTRGQSASLFASWRKTICALVLALAAGSQANGDTTAVHPDNPAMAREHMALLDLVSLSDVTDTAVASGSWFVGTTWQSGSVPGPQARLLIPADMTVTYDGKSDAPLKTLRVDGELRFAPDQDSRMVIDTLVVAPAGRLEIGTSVDPVAPDVRIEILISGDGDIDMGWDPLLLSRGVISHGEVEIHGAVRTPFLKVAAAPLQGADVLVLATPPKGWRVGDRLVVTGTRKRGWAWDNETQTLLNHPSQDEVVTITALEGDRVSIDRPLMFNHDAPRADLAAYVANLTRNIVFASLGGDQTPLAQRGHVMFMHSDRVDVAHAAFNDLGRTDKSREAFDITALPDVTPTSNIKGRYSVHLHKTGMANQETPATVTGCVVIGSPGWGYVHHSSHADFVDNVAFGVFGAAFAAEDGDETGLWLRNIAIRSLGFDRGQDAAKRGVERHDNGRTGDGFFFAGRLVEAAENVAANTTHGFVWMTRSAPSAPTLPTLHQPEIAYGKPVVDPEVPPIQGFRDNEAFCTDIGLMVIKKNPSQGHDVRSVLDGFVNWETFRGVDISYSGHYTLLDFDLIGTVSQGYFAADAGMEFGTNTFDIVMNRVRLERFPIGIRMVQGSTFAVAESEIGFVLIDIEAQGVPQLIESSSMARYRLLTTSDLLANEIAAFPRTTVIRSNEDLPLWMDTTDSLGRTARQHPGDAQTINRWEVADLVRSTGYFTAPDGRTLALVPDFIADRATGTLMKHSVPVTLDIADAELQSWGAAYHGTYDPENTGPVARDDRAETTVGKSLTIEPLANDSDPEGAELTLQGTTDPRHGDLVVKADGRLLYRPHPGYAGPDQFTYWAADGAGNFAPASVDIEVVSP